MGTNWNPNATDSLGLEWRATLEGKTALTAREQAVGIYLPSDAADTISNLYVPHEWAGAGGGNGVLWADIYDKADAIEGARTIATYYPNEDKANDGYIINGYGWVAAPGSIYTLMDDTSDGTDPWADWAANSEAGQISKARFQFGTNGFPANKRPVAVWFEIRALGYYWGWKSPSLEISHWYHNTKKGVLGTINVPNDDVWRTYTLGPFYWDWNDEGPWNRQTILDFDDNTKDNIGIEFRYGVTITRMAMKVAYVTEKRVAVAKATRQTTVPSGVQTNLPLATAAVGTSVAGNWSKANGTNYLVVVRRIDSLTGTQFTPSVLYLDAGEAGPDDVGRIYPVTLTDAGGDIASVGDPTTRYASITPGTSGGASSVDSQPYWDLEAKPCHASSTLAQGFNGAAATTYDKIRVLVGISTEPTAKLTAKIKKTAGGAQQGGDADFTVADLADPDKASYIGSRTLYDGRSMDVYQIILTLASDATLAAATNYYVEFTSTTTEAWFLLWLDSTASHALTGNQTYGGSNNVATVAAVNNNYADFMMVVSSGVTPPIIGDDEPPGPPVAGAVQVRTTALPDAGDVICDVGDLEYVNVAWTATALGADFDHYDIQRSEDAGVTWIPVAYITTEATAAWEDYQAPRQVAVKYRIRVVRIDGAVSDWSTMTNDVTCGSSGAQVVLFTSNDDPTLNCGFILLDPDYQYDFLSADDLVLVKRYGLNYQTPFRPVERRGVGWSFRVLVYTRGNSMTAQGSPPDGEGVRAFDTLRAIAETQAQVAVLTPDGERFYAALKVPSGVRNAKAHYYAAPVTMIQTSDEPTVVVL